MSSAVLPDGCRVGLPAHVCQRRLAPGGEATKNALGTSHIIPPPRSGTKQTATICR